MTITNFNMDNETLESLPTFTTEGGKAESTMIKMLRSTAEAANEALESATAKITVEERSALLDSDSEIRQTTGVADQFFTSESENVTLDFTGLPENVTISRDVEMFPHMDEHVGNYIALGFLFAFLISVAILVTVVIIFCLKRRKKMKLEKSIVKVENPKYASQPSKYPQSFDFLSSQNVRAEFKNRQDESSATLITLEKTSPRATNSVDDQSVCAGLHPSESNKGEGKRLSKASDFPGASLASIRNDSSSDASVYLRDANENVSLASCGKSPTANKKGLPARPNDSPMKGRAPVASIDFEESESNANSESLSHPLLGEPKVFNRFLKSKEPEIAEDDDVYEDDDENATNQTTSLLKSKEQSLLSLGSYDQSLNPFCN